MSDIPVSLIEVLASADMLVIDGLHAFEFQFDDAGLAVESMDGRTRKQWRFTREQLASATFDVNKHSWNVASDLSNHAIECMSAVTVNEDDEDE